MENQKTTMKLKLGFCGVSVWFFWVGGGGGGGGWGGGWGGGVGATRMVFVGHPKYLGLYPTRALKKRTMIFTAYYNRVSHTVESRWTRGLPGDEHAGGPLHRLCRGIVCI